jgi:hypothetical protein
VRPTHLVTRAKGLVMFINGARTTGDSMLIRRSRFDEVGGFGDLYAVDWELALKLCTVGDIVYNQNVLMQYRVWAAPGRTVPSQLRYIRFMREFYDLYEPRFPELRATFRRARLRRALGAVETLTDMSPEERRTATRDIRGISGGPLVEAKIRAVELGFGGAFVAARELQNRGRRALKSLLYPLLSPTR